MSTSAVSDYITKQIFIEKNVVTYRSLSRQFALHVNAAKNELATYHHNAPYQSQNSCAIFLISGTLNKTASLRTQDSENLEEKNGADEDGSDEVSQTTILLVNEKDLESAKARYDEIYSVHVYSLAPAPLIDAALICTCTESVRSIDRSKGAEWAALVGRVLLSDIKIGPPKKGKPPVMPREPCIAGPSKSKPPPELELPTTKQEPVKAKVRQSSSFMSADQAKEKHNGTEKLNFFTKGKDTKNVKLPDNVKKVKKEGSVVDFNKQIFFLKPTKETVDESASVKEEERIRKKPSSRDDSQTKAKNNPPAAETSTAAVRRKANIVLSDEDSDEAPIKSTSRRKLRASFNSESSFALDSEIEREGRALMDLDDDQVERVSHAPSTVVSELEDESEADSAPAKKEQDDGYIVPDSPPANRPKKRKVNVGRNGLKKRKVVRTRSRKDDNGYIYKEDYTDWESVYDEEPEIEKRPKTKTSTVKREATKEDERLPSATPEDARRKDDERTRKLEPAAKSAASKAKPKASGNVKTQKGLMNFFGPSKKT